MPKYPVLQPDGKLAVWSTITDTFSYLDCTVDEAADGLLQWYTGFVASNVTRPELYDMVSRCAAGEMVYPFWRDWAHLVAWTTYFHDGDEEITGGLIERTPDPMTRRYIEQFVATCKAESHADDLNTELIAARQRIAELEAGQRNAQQSIDYLQVERERMNTRVAELEARPAITWIPVAERLPDTELRVLAAYNDGRMTTTLRALYIPKFAVECYEFETDIETEYDEATDTTYYPSGWYEAIEEGEYSMIGPLTGTVTHWATLPALPKVEVKP